MMDARLFRGGPAQYYRLASCAAKPSAASVVTVQDEQTLVFQKERLIFFVKSLD